MFCRGRIFDMSIAASVFRFDFVSRLRLRFRIVEGFSGSKSAVRMYFFTSETA